MRERMRERIMRQLDREGGRERTAVYLHCVPPLGSIQQILKVHVTQELRELLISEAALFLPVGVDNLTHIDNHRNSMNSMKLRTVVRRAIVIASILFGIDRQRVNGFTTIKDR